MSDENFPRRFKPQHVSFRLVLIRRIPGHPRVALYCSLPTFSKGRLVEDYLVVGPEQTILAKAGSLAEALTKLFRHQPALGSQERRRRKGKPARSRSRTGPLKADLA
ncbi:MAG TPA: hypothetical protein V6D23_08890 [Candidatus Obscuribacterales bacterium]